MPLWKKNNFKEILFLEISVAIDDMAVSDLD